MNLTSTVSVTAWALVLIATISAASDKANRCPAVQWVRPCIGSEVLVLSRRVVEAPSRKSEGLESTRAESSRET